MAAPLSAENALPLEGKHVVITRPSTEGEDILQFKLRSWGARVSLIPLVEVRPVPWNLENAEEPFDWLFFTSRNAVNGFFQTVGTGFEATPIAVVGPTTGQALQTYGRSPMFVSPKYQAEHAATAFCESYNCKNLRVLWPCGNLANPIFPEVLSAAGATVQSLIVYETVPKEELSDEEVRCLQSKVDMLVFTSPSAVSAWDDLASSLNVAMTNTFIACLGPTTANAAIGVFGHVDIQAIPITLDALADGIRAFYTDKEH